MPDLVTESAKPLTESEVARVLKDYRNTSNKIDTLSSLDYTYLTESGKNFYKTDIINRLIKQSQKLNAAN